MARNAQLKCLMDAYSKAKLVNPETLLFMFKGCALNTDLTVNELQLKDEDVIDVRLCKTSYSVKVEVEAHQKPKSVPSINAHPSKAPVSVNGCTINSAIQLEMKMDDILSVHQQQQNSQVDTMLQHQEEHKKLETKIDSLLSVQQRRQSEIILCSSISKNMLQQESQIDTLLHNLKEYVKLLETKMDPLYSAQQQQRSQIGTMLQSKLNTGRC